MIATTKKQLTPPIKWVGSKFRQPLVHQFVSSHYEPYRNTHTFLEPFVGAMGMTFRVTPNQAVLCDSNVHLIAYYHWLQRIDRYSNWDKYALMSYTDLVNIYNVYLECQDLDKLTSEAFKDFPTVLKCLISRSFNGLYRVNGSGKFNAPEGKQRDNFVHSEPFLDGYKDVLKPWSFQAKSYSQTLSEIQPDDKCFIYADPPYYGTEVSYGGTFTLDSHILMAQILSKLKQPLIISNSANQLIIDIYKEFGFLVNLIDEDTAIGRLAQGKNIKSKSKCIIATLNLPGSGTES